jgi:hypothetical protein
VNVNEPTALYDTNCQVVVATNCLKLWYTSTSGNSTGYAESLLSPIAFTNFGDVATSNCHQPAVVKVGGTYHLYCSHLQTQIDHYTSTNGTSWTLANAAVISLGSAGAWDANQVCNPTVTVNPDGSGNWYMLYCGNALSGAWGDGAYRTGGATSPDGVTWTKVTANPVTGQTDTFPQLTQGEPSSINYINGVWYEWDGQISRFASPTFNGLWIWDQPHLSLLASAFNEGNGTTAGYGADPTMIEVSGKCYLFYDANDANTDKGVIKVAIANMPMSQLVTTSEGATTDWP